VFILYAIPIGLIAGLVLGGRIDRLGDVRFRLTPLAILALAIQVVLFSPLGAGLDEAVSRAIYVASTVLVAVVVVVNLRVTGVPLILLGAASNLLAIVANGGAMPASPAALASLGMGVGENTNSVVLERPAFEPLTDIFATPAWVPFSNVFSVGDVLIAAGVAIAIAAAMRRPRMDRSDARGALPH
jgi:uncharacterized membrane protein YidH (DUF202 family)